MSCKTVVQIEHAELWNHYRRCAKAASDLLETGLHPEWHRILSVHENFLETILSIRGCVPSMIVIDGIIEQAEFAIKQHRMDAENIP